MIMSETRAYVWKTTGSVYVDSNYGDDTKGDGSKLHPFKTLTKADEYGGTTIVCRGLFQENLNNGNHSKMIVGDYYGAAVFDGDGKYGIYGYGVNNMIVLNCYTESPTESVRQDLRGVGRAGNWGYVGVANSADQLFGVGPQSAFVGNSGLYWGVIGGYTAPNMGVTNIVYWKPYASPSLLSLGWLGENSLNYCTVYEAGFDEDGIHPYKMQKSIGKVSGSITGTIMSKTVIILNDNFDKTFTNCLFDKDCKFYYFTKDSCTSEDDYIEVDLKDVEGSTNEEKASYLVSELDRLYRVNGVAESSRKTLTFDRCIFSSQGAYELFNNPEKMDMTLKMDSEANLSTGYLGALPPARPIGIVNNSQGVKDVWDTQTASGMVEVKDGKIYINTGVNSTEGSIMSKVIVVNSREVQFNGIYSIVRPKTHQGLIIGGNNLYYPNAKDPSMMTGDIFENYAPENKMLTKGIYVVTSESVLVNNEELYAKNKVINIVESDYPEGKDGVPYDAGDVVKIIEPSAGDVLYCRCRNAIYQYLDIDDTGRTKALTKGGTYINVSGGNIEYNSRTIINGESFIADAEVGATGRVGVLFDADGAPESEWIPARLWGEYFVKKENGLILHDDNGVPQSSGNIHTSTTGAKSIMDRNYVQFKIMVTRFNNK
jgi:hypothetical protein